VLRPISGSESLAPSLPARAGGSLDSAVPEQQDAVILSAPRKTPSTTPTTAVPLEAPAPEPEAAPTPLLDSPHERFLASIVPERAAQLSGGVWHGTRETSLPTDLRFPNDSNSAYVDRRYALHHLENGYTELHMKVASQLANRFAMALDGTRYALLEDEKKALAEAGDMFDLGKVCVSSQALEARGPLSEEQSREIARHVLVRTNRFPDGGDPVVEKLFSAMGQGARQDGVREIVRHHHERWDGQGYPDGLKGHDIPLTAQVMGLADAWDALTQRRPWRLGLDYEQARAGLEEQTAKGQFNPELAQLFLERVMPGPEALKALNGERLGFAKELHQSYEWLMLRDAQDMEISLGQGYVNWERLEQDNKPRPDSALRFEEGAEEHFRELRQVQAIAQQAGPSAAISEGLGYLAVGGIRLSRRSRPQ
jgi:hypothetical protein